MEVALRLLTSRLKRFGVHTCEVDNILKAMSPEARRVPAGQPIIDRATNRPSVFLIQSGWISLHHDLYDGRRQILDFALPGTLAGLFSGIAAFVPYSATALTDADVVIFPHRAFLKAIDNSEDLRKAVRRLVAHEELILVEHLVNIGLRSASERIMHFLLETRCRLEAVGQTEGDSFPLPVAQSTLGMALGLTTVHTNRTLQTLRRQRLIETCPTKRMRILNINEATRSCGFDPSYLE